MDASNYMDKQIMDLSRSKISYSNHDLIDLMKPLPISDDEDEKAPGDSLNKDNHCSYDFHPSRSVGLPSRFSDSPPMGGGGAPRAWNSADAKSNYSPTRSYDYLGSIESGKVVLGKAQNVNDTAILSDIDRSMKRYTDNVLHAMDGLRARLSQLETRTWQIEHSVDDLKVSIGNNHRSTDGKARHIENIILEVKSCVQDLKDKQEIINAQIQLQKLQKSKVDQTPETHSSARFEPPERQLSPPAQFPVPSIHPPAQMPNHYPPASMPAGPQRESYQPPAGPTQELPSQQYPPPPAPIPTGPQRDTYQLPAGPSQEVPNQQYWLPPSHQQHPQYQPGPPTPYPHQPSQPNPQLHPPVAHHSEAPHTYPFQQPSSQPSSIPPPSQQFYSAPPYTSPTEGYAYGGPSSNYGKNPVTEPHPHSSGSGSKYTRIPTAKILPQAIPTASSLGGGGGSGNRVRIDDVVDKVTNMGFTSEQVNATVRKLTENGQPVDLNVVLDKLMNDADVQTPRGWYGR